MDESISRPSGNSKGIAATRNRSAVKPGAGEVARVEGWNTGNRAVTSSRVQMPPVAVAIGRPKRFDAIEGDEPFGAGMMFEEFPGDTTPEKRIAAAFGTDLDPDTARELAGIDQGLERIAAPLDRPVILEKAPLDLGL